MGETAPGEERLGNSETMGHFILLEPTNIFMAQSDAFQQYKIPTPTDDRVPTNLPPVALNFSSSGLSGSKSAKCNKHGVVNGPGIVEECADDLLESFNASCFKGRAGLEG